MKPANNHSSVLVPHLVGRLASALLCVLLGAGCSGGRYDGDVPGAASDTASTGADAAQFFAERVQPRLAFCRTCHVPGGVADTDEGRRFLLSSNSGDDYVNMYSAWKTLGRGVETNLLLIEPGHAGEPHSGGKPWFRGGDAYREVRLLLQCWNDPGQCALGAAGAVAPELPLLGSKRASHVWESYCADKADDAALPADPRTSVRPGTNLGKAVFFNGYWEDCHANAPAAEQQAKTCGEYRARRERGRDFLLNELPVAAMSAQDFNNSWQKWGLSERPENFEELYSLRYGLNHAPFPNPYPLPGEDPAATDGGSGQLPLGLRQLKDDNGNWTGEIGSAACFLCHGGQIGEPRAGEPQIIGVENLGLGNNNYDVIMNSRDNSPWAQATIVADTLPAMDVNTLFNIGIKQRGQNNAVGAFELLNTILDLDSLGVNPNPLKLITPGGAQGVMDVSHPLAHTQDTPPWWNMGVRPRKFFDAGVSNDSTRIIMAAGPGEFQELFSFDGAYYRNRIEQYDQDLEAFFLSLRSPAYPAAIDTALAEQGAILFHTKNLWAEPGNAQRPPPVGGNGSCASCHGAYSPRFVNDPGFLEDPALEGIASHISPLAVIGTDPARSDMLTPTLRAGWDTTYWGYPDGVEGYVAPEDKDPVTEALDDLLPIDMRPQGLCGWQKAVIGYQAPPLYGVWATAPYLHNGSVPTLAQLLDSSSRPQIWQRKLLQQGEVIGFDQRLSTAFDFQGVGWQHEVLSCADIPGTELLNCNPVDDEGPSLVELAQNLLNSTISWAGLVSIPDPDPEGVDKRLVYDSRILGNGNRGHAFSDVLTEVERQAIIEYLKTL